MKKLFKEPLLHFAALGTVIFTLNAWRQNARLTETSAARIEVPAAVIDRLRAGYERQFGQTPEAEELRGLVTAHSREEVLCHEALTLGLDRDDTIVRRRLAISTAKTARLIGIFNTSIRKEKNTTNQLGFELMIPTTRQKRSDFALN